MCVLIPTSSLSSSSASTVSPDPYLLPVLFFCLHRLSWSLTPPCPLLLPPPSLLIPTSSLSSSSASTVSPDPYLLPVLFFCLHRLSWSLPPPCPLLLPPPSLLIPNSSLSSSSASTVSPDPYLLPVLFFCLHRLSWSLPPPCPLLLPPPSLLIPTSSLSSSSASTVSLWTAHWCPSVQQVINQPSPQGGGGGHSRPPWHVLAGCHPLPLSPPSPLPPSPCTHRWANPVLQPSCLSSLVSSWLFMARSLHLSV